MSLAPHTLAGLFGLGGPELIIILLIILLLFGGSKLPALAKGLGESIREFKKAARDEPTDKKSEEKKNGGSDANKLHNN
jgi:sec-independent protein translocase protein TatA